MSDSSEPKEVRVHGIDPPYRVTDEKVSGHPAYENRYTLYRGDVEITAVHVRYLSETDAMARRLREFAILYESTRVHTLAILETMREAERGEPDA
ncbi:hypothetical protein SEA_ZOOMAN_291 [Microbacterium phage Zooman]|nr:hypothetical protein SEA_ZOOMAN_291 [Microbacterium phage Zooman]